MDDRTDENEASAQSLILAFPPILLAMPADDGSDREPPQLNRTVGMPDHFTAQDPVQE